MSACAPSNSENENAEEDTTSSFACFWSDSCDSGRNDQNTSFHATSCTPLQQSGGLGSFIYTHNLNASSGRLNFSYTVNGAAVQFVVTTPTDIILNTERSGSDSINFNVSNESLVFVGIEASDSTSNWQFTLGCPSSSSTVITEQEPNNDSSSAQQLLGEFIEVNGSVNQDTDFEDFFSFTPTASGSYTLDLSGFDVSNSDLDLYISDAQSQVVISASLSTDDAESITLDLAAGIEYIIKVQGFNTASSTVNYVFTIQPGFASNVQISLNETENNDVQTPQTIQSDSFVVSGTVNEETDFSDAFEFTATSTQLYTFTLTGDVADNDLYFFSSPVVDINAPINASTRAASNESLTVNLEQGVSYVVEVYAYGDNDPATLGVDAPYSLSVEPVVLDTIVIPSGDSASINDSLDETNNLRDSYQFTPNSSQVFNIGISAYSGDIDLSVLDDTGATIASSTLGGNSPDAVAVELIAGTTYTINVDAYAISGIDNYTLDINAAGNTTVTPVVPQNVISEVEPNNDDAQAQAINVDAIVVTGTVDTQTDEFDFYAFTPTTSKSFTISLVGFVGDLDLIILSGDSTSGFVVEGESFSSIAGGAESIMLPLTADTIYYIGINAFDTASADTYFMEIQ